MSQLVCSKCGQEIEPRKMRGEESLIRLSDRDILAANRWFDAECPQCGPVLQNKMGHHSTIQSKRLKTLFAKVEVARLRSKLSVDESRRLKAAREGKQAPTEDEINRWCEMAK
jgi:hypothetical protein